MSMIATDKPVPLHWMKPLGRGKRDRASSSLEDRHRLDLNQESRKGQRLHPQPRTCREVRIPKVIPHRVANHRGLIRSVVHDMHAQPNHVAHGCARSAERGDKIRECRARLCPKVARADHLIVRVDRDLARDKTNSV